VSIMLGMGLFMKMEVWRAESHALANDASPKIAGQQQG